jgi:DMSO/TMAO reductase YedYZ molybdopterin-dependent catalytic subunit
MSYRRGALAGGLAAGVALAMTSLADAVVGTIPSLVGAVAQAFLRAAPGFVSRTAIETLGHADKPALRIGTIVIALLIGAAAGALATRRRWVGDVTLAAFGALGVACAAWLPGMSIPGAAVSATVAAVAGAFTLRALLVTPAVHQVALPVPGQGVDRRRFLAAAGTVAVAVAGTRLAARPHRVEALTAAGPSPDFGPPVTNRGLAVDGLSPLVTPNGDFYRTDEALIIPRVNAGSWRLRIDGLVERPYELTYDQLLAMDLVEADVTLACVSNAVGGTLVGNAHWTGVRLDTLLERAGVKGSADQVVGKSVDGFSAGFPTTVLDGRDALVAVAMNGKALPAVHGFPARLVVPGLYGYVSATKWLRQIELTTFDAFDAYWVRRGWAKLGPIKIESRIDVPRDTAVVRSGRRPVAGVAWAPHRGIGTVEVRVDDGPWQATELGPVLGNDAWRQWVLPWDAAPGHHVIEVRATTADGETQTAGTQSPYPDGATGHHRVRVEVT